jgi:hypothetical protein
MNANRRECVLTPRILGVLNILILIRVHSRLMSLFDVAALDLICVNLRPSAVEFSSPFAVRVRLA